MAANGKAEPAREPGLGRPLAERLEQAIAGQPPERPITVNLRVGGGLPGQGYRFDLHVSSDGEARCEFSDAARSREGRMATSELDRRQLDQLLASIARSGVLDQAPPPPRFLPDTLVGMLEVTDDEVTYRAYFAADPEQAKAQAPMSPPLQEAVDATYRFGARLLGRRAVKP